MRGPWGSRVTVSRIRFRCPDLRRPVITLTGGATLTSITSSLKPVVRCRIPEDESQHPVALAARVHVRTCSVPRGWGLRYHPAEGDVRESGAGVGPRHHRSHAPAAVLSPAPSAGSAPPGGQWRLRGGPRAWERQDRWAQPGEPSPGHPMDTWAIESAPSCALQPGAAAVGAGPAVRASSPSAGRGRNHTDGEAWLIELVASASRVSLRRCWPEPSAHSWWGREHRGHLSRHQRSRADR